MSRYGIRTSARRKMTVGLLDRIIDMLIQLIKAIQEDTEKEFGVVIQSRYGIRTE